MADIVVGSKKKINLFDRVIQSVVIIVNMNKMNRAIDEHLAVIRKTEGDDKKLYQENILREIVFVKYQYDIMQREMYDLKISYPIEIIEKINSTEKTERLELQKSFLELEYDRVTKSKFKSRDEIKFNLLAISSAIDEVKQNIKDEGKSQRYNKVIKCAEDIDVKIQTDDYEEEIYTELFQDIDEYVGYINDNYDISKLPSDERELIEFVIETMIQGIESDIDRHMYEYNLIVNICKNSYRYFKVIDKIFEKLQSIYDESIVNDILSLKDYVKMYRDIYDTKIKTMVNDVHRTIKTEDEYLEYSKLLASDEEDAKDKVNEFILNRALSTTNSEIVKNKIEMELKDEEEIENSVEEVEEVKEEVEDIKQEEKEEKMSLIDRVAAKLAKKAREENKADSKEKKPKEVEGEPKKRRGRPRKIKVEE